MPTWIPIWSWPSTKYPNAMIILLQASEEMASAMNVAPLPSCSRYLLEAVKNILPFEGMTYAMRDKKDLTFVKVGSAGDASERMKESPWCKTLGFTSHEDRLEEVVLACINIPGAHVEKCLQEALSPPALEKGHGREWFRRKLNDFALAFEKLTKNKNEAIWFNQDATRAEVESLRSEVLPSNHSGFETFAELGEIDFVHRHANGVDVFSSIWCPVRYEIAEHDIPMPFYGPPDNCRHLHLAAQLRTFDVDGFDAEPDVVRRGHRLISRSSCQRIHQIIRVDSVLPDCDPDLDVTLNEWEIDGQIYEIDYRTKVSVRERFRVDSAGAIQREICEQAFEPTVISRPNLPDKLRKQPALG